VSAILLNYGPLGVAVLALGLAVLKLYRDNATLHDRLLDEREKRVEAFQDAAATIRRSNHETKELAGMLISTLRSLPPKRNSGTE
jgi:hypothetical protein